MKIIAKADMLEIGAVADLRSYMTSQESASDNQLKETAFR
jgi:hypothetical protein